MQKYLETVGTPPFENTWHASYSDTWHALSSESPSSGSSYKVHVVRFSYPNYLKEDQTTLINITSGRLTQYIRMINICHLDIIVWIIDWSKARFTRYHNNQPWPTFRHLQGERTRWSDNKSLPTIISHDHFPRSLTAASPTTILVSRP